LSQKYYNAFIETKEKVITQVLTNILKREPTVDDFKKVTIVIKENAFCYEYLVYDNFKIGTLKIGYSDKNMIKSCIFQPFNDVNFLMPAFENGKFTLL
jgi:hypothetical protein